MDSKDVCLQLLSAESEDAVQAVIESIPEMMYRDNWYPLDGRETNFNVVTNQAATGGKAATELMTNMVDAILMKSAYQNGVDPRGYDAPKNMYEAVDELVHNLRGGRLVDADSAWLRDYAKKNLVIGITGDKDTRKRTNNKWPCYTFIDNGEGQHPDDFPQTFLSLSEGNKKEIPFVQGKYNMGSSGVLGYCGRRWFKLIISRKWDKSSDWGWTLVRRRPSGTDDIPIAEYFAPDRKVPRFESDLLFPLHTQDGSRYSGASLPSGTVVKLFDFHVGKKFKDWTGAREAFYENLTETILPFWLMDFRQTKTEKRPEGIDERGFYGMEYVLRRTHKAEDDDQTEDGAGEGRHLVGEIESPEIGRADIYAIPVKEMPGWLQPRNSNNRVFHAVNGQVQYKQTRAFVSRCGYAGLMDRMVLIIDASKLTPYAHNEVWKGDREHLRENDVGEGYLASIEDVIRRSEYLKNFRNKVAREELSRIATQETNDLFQRLVDNDKDLISFLDNRDPTIKLTELRGEPPEYEGEYSPTFILLERPKNNEPVVIPINRTGTISAQTDAAADYFTRADNRGQLYISDNRVRELFSISRTLFNGKLTVFLTPNIDRVETGDTFEFEVGLEDPAMPAQVSAAVVVRIGDEKAPEPKTKNKKERPQKDEPQPRRGLPRVAYLTKDGRDVMGQPSTSWSQSGKDINELDGGYVSDTGDDGLIYYVNIDNSHFHKFERKAKGDEAKGVLLQKYVTGMRLLMLGYENALQKVMAASPEEERDKLLEQADELRRTAARGAAATVLWLTDTLPKVISLPQGPE